MKRSLLPLIFLALFAACAHAATPREQFNQLVQQLQQSPGDTALREKIIKAARALKPAPAMPEEAKRRMGRGQAALEMAKSPADYENAAAEFQAATNAAPWRADAYYNLGVAQEKAGQPAAAMASFKLYLVAAPKAKDREEIEQRIYKLDYAADQAAKAAAAAAEKEKARQAAEAEKERKRQMAESVLSQLRQKVEGATYSRKFCETGVIGGDDGRLYASSSEAFRAGNSSARGNGCTREEYGGRNWVDGGSGAVERFDFSEKGVVKLVFIDSFPAVHSVGVIGTPDGPAISDIRWECPVIAWEGPNAKMTGTKPAWVDLSWDGSWISYTCDTPTPQNNPSAKFQYTGFKRN
jgi:hypothetical protein